MVRFASQFARCAVAALSFATMCGAAAAQSPYKVIDHWKIGGTGGWDYLLADSANHLLYVTHGPRVEIVDTKTGKPAGAITGMKGTHGIALDTDGKYGYISDGGGNDVLVFDRHNFSTRDDDPRRHQSRRHRVRPGDEDGVGVQRQKQQRDRDRRGLEQGGSHHRAAGQAGVSGSGWQGIGVREYRDEELDCSAGCEGQDGGGDVEAR